MPTITIDDQAYEVKEGDNVLQACLGLGIDLPYFCWHPAMGSIGACRQCALVQFQNEEDSRGRIVMGCMTPVTEGARFSLAGDKATLTSRVKTLQAEILTPKGARFEIDSNRPPTDKEKQNEGTSILAVKVNADAVRPVEISILMQPVVSGQALAKIDPRPLDQWPR